MIIMIFSFSFILITSLNLQNLAYQRFQEEQYFQELKHHLDAIQEPLKNYLINASSSSMRIILEKIEILNEKVPKERPITSNESDLLKREIYFLIDAYINRANVIIEQKRGRKVFEYTRSFEELNRLYEYITSRINTVSLYGLRFQLEEYQSFLNLFKKIQMQNLLLIVIATAFAYSLLMQMVNRITKPMLELSQMADQISAGNFNIPEVEFKAINEVDRVASAFNKMKSSIHHYIKELQNQKKMEQEIMNERVLNLKMEQLLKRMELYTMQAQMNPHFLFNTINTGVQLAIVEEAEKTAEFMEILANLFRYNIREKKFFVPLRHEYEGLKSYYTILKIRFPKTLRLVLDIDESLLDKYTCPAMILQPLVENSVLHAFKNTGKLGTIKVSFSFDDPILTISVSDNGVGIPEKTVGELLKTNTRDYQLGPKVMGLENVIQRCYFFYPDQKDVIQINTSPGKGTEIIIRIHTEVKPCIEL